jgi:hypothetical protein
MLSDIYGNVYLVGNYSPTTDFDPSNGVVNLPNNGSFNIYFSKYDSLGNYIWARGIGGPFADVPHSMAIDGLNNQYITGYFTGSMDFDPGIGNTTISFPSSNQNIFIAKYNGIYTGINDGSEFKTNKIDVLPNPSNRYINLTGVLAEKKGNIKIIDFCGQIILNEPYYPKQIIDVSSLPPGMYIIEMNSSGQMARVKFIKQ